MSPSSIKHHHHHHNSPTTNTLVSASLRSIAILVLFTFISMSMFYQVMGAVRCPKIKKHAGLKLKPIHHSAKDAFVPGDVILYSCETNEQKQSIKCLEDGRWSELPHCPDPTNHTCPDLGPLEHGSYNVSSDIPLKVGTLVAFKCDNELLNLPTMNTTTSNNSTSALKRPKEEQKYTIPTTTLNANINEIGEGAPTLATTKPLLSVNGFEDLQSPPPPPPTNQTITTTIINDIDFSSSSTPSSPSSSSIRYNLTGHRILRCLPSSKWNHPMPICSPIIPKQQTNIGSTLASVFFILMPILIFLIIVQLFIRWKKRQQQQERWKQYFDDYKHRCSKTSITYEANLQTSCSPSKPKPKPNNSNSNNNYETNNSSSGNHQFPVTDL